MNRIEQFRRIVANRTAGKVEGHYIDLFTASVCCTVYDNFESDKARARFKEMPLEVLLTVCMTVYGRRSGGRRA